MTKPCLFFLLFSFLFIAACNRPPVKSAKVTYQSVESGHPRLLLLKGEERAIQQAVQQNSNLKKVHDAIIVGCDEFLKQPVLKRELTGRRLLGISRECIRRVFYLSYAYRMTGNKEYAKRAEDEMLSVSAFTDWNPSHFLDVGEMALGLAIGYDWLYDYLPQSSKDIIKKAIVKKGIEPSFSDKGTWWINGTNNWNQVCHAGISYGALALYEEDKDRAEAILRRAVTNLPAVMKGYNPDGAYPEGYGYWAYGTMFNVLFIDAYEKFKKTDYSLDGLSGFLKTPYYMLHMEGASGNSFNYSDAGNGVDIQPAMYWFAKKTKDPSLIWNEAKFIEKNNVSKLIKERTLPALLIWAKDFATSKIAAPKALTWGGAGPNPVYLMRTSWTDPNAIYMGLKCGSPSISHGHMDIGSFVLDADGERWASDFGMQNYNSLESKGVDLWNMRQNSQRWTIFRYNNFAHNTLTINNQLQLVNSKAELSSHSSDKNFMNAVTDLTDVYKGQLKSAKRGVAIVKGQYALVRDEVEAKDKSFNLRWTMMTTAAVKIDDQNTVTLTKGGKKLIMKINHSRSISIKQWPTTSANDYDAPNPGTTLIGFEAEVPANEQANFDVVLFPAKNKNSIDYKVDPLTEWPKD